MSLDVRFFYSLFSPMFCQHKRYEPLYFSGQILG